ncbi:membrane protein [Paenibacillus darwinianus]|uniref:Membrane protein n=1 Tax=Paenibacillus darwinianus TaxID=1380763 RepID=A0A9W5W7T6_9BACL|nr:DMT family transporter [Paenibacillus darwinianus]EXX88899.1 membrane protein [Paenibacillus darwinianus]EXX89095.1 membrane protein [Paenibacillus darwinianus]EXX90426.1 membrane protein [Paenibacillus darwinianus]
MLYVIILMVTFIWGINGIIDRQALQTGHPLEVNFITAFTMLIVALVYLMAAKLGGMPFQFHRNTVLFAMTNGILVPTAYVVFLYALSRGSLTTVVTITATYPIVTFVLAVLLMNEAVSASKVAGMALIVLGLFLFVRQS